MSDIQSVCAYCKKPGKLTKEHLYPRFLYARTGERHLGYNEAADKVTRGERVVRDVCSVCNNDILSKLDAYGERYFQVNRLDQSFSDSGAIEVRYEYDLLLRWVMKVSFNSFRTVASDENPFASLVQFILTGRDRPKAKFVKLFLELIRDHKLTEEERPRVSEQFRETGYVPCQMLASGRATNLVNAGCHCRHFQVNAHRFILLIFRYRTRPSDISRFVQSFQRQYRFAKYIEPESTQIEVPVSDRDIFDLHAGDDVHPMERLAEADYAKQTGR